MVGLLAVLAAEVFSAQQPTSAGDTCTVSRVVDGDTFYCADGLKVRLTGIDSPERGQGPDYEQARDALRRLLPGGRRVRLETDVVPQDRYGRRLAYVWYQDTLANEAMIRAGWAVSYTVPPNIKYADRFAAAQRLARAERAGLWSSSGFECLPSDFRRGQCPDSGHASEEP
jgi:micrococcal nuclease